MSQRKKISIKKISLPILNISMIFALLIGLIWFVIMQKQDQQKIVSLQQKQQQLTINQLANQKTLAAELQQKEQSLQQLSTSIDDLLKKATLSDRNEKLSLIKAEIVQAQHSIDTNYNYSRALSLLNSAQQSLNTLNQNDLGVLQEALKNNITAVKNANNALDLNANLKRLEAINTLAGNIPNTPPLTFTPPPQPTVQPSEKKHWYGKIKTILSGFKNLVVIRHYDKGYKPLLSMSDIQIVKNNIILKTNQAQWALLRHEQPLFTHCLQTINQQLKKLPQEKTTQTIASIIKKLEQSNISPPPPQFKTTLALINEQAPETSNSSRLHMTT
jgi:uncharacterized protein HemX